MAELTRVHMTADKFLELPETVTPTQLIDGEVIVSPSPELAHQDAVLNVATLLKQKITEGKVRISPIDVWLDELNVVQPDVLWMSESGLCKPSENRKSLVGAPELIIEVLSPSTEKQDRGKKFTLYEKYGVREYWMLHPQAQFAEVYIRADDKFKRLGVFGADEIFHSPLLDQNIELKPLFTD